MTTVNARVAVRSAADQPGASRRGRALETRRRIVEAAYRLFCRQGYAATTMEAIAAAAGVAVQTLYFTFHTKAAILGEALGACIVGFDTWTPPVAGVRLGDPNQLRTFHSWFAAFEAEKNARRALSLFLGAGVEVMERAAPLVHVMREAAGEAEARAVAELAEARRIDSYTAIIRELSKKRSGLRKGLTVRRATDVLLTVVSAESYQMLRNRGWKPREVQVWFAEVLGQQLLQE